MICVAQAPKSTLGTTSCHVGAVFEDETGEACGESDGERHGSEVLAMNEVNIGKHTPAAYDSPPSDKVQHWDLGCRARRAWDRYLEFQAEPGHRCSRCWLLHTHCRCAEFHNFQLRHRVVVLMHHAELEQQRGSNTAKLLLPFGAELLVWGIDQHEARLRELLATDGFDDAIVLFPAPDAIPAAELAPVDVNASLPRCIVVLDGGWKETRKMNLSIDSRIRRCCITSTRDEYGATRKYRDANRERVQTAAAFICLMKELGEDAACVEGLRAGLACFMEAFESQIRWSGVHQPRVTPARSREVQVQDA